MEIHVQIKDGNRNLSCRETYIGVHSTADYKIIFCLQVCPRPATPRPYVMETLLPGCLLGLPNGVLTESGNKTRPQPGPSAPVALTGLMAGS